MTRKELSEYFYIHKLKEEAELELERLLSERNAKIMPMDDMPHAPYNTSNPTADLAIAIEEQISILRAMINNLHRRETAILKFIGTLEVEDSYLAMIVKYRCLDLLTWEDVAIRIGGSNSAESCRQYYCRHIPMK